MKADGVSHDAWRVEHAFKILDSDENHRHPKRVPPIAPLKSRDQHSGDPTKNDADVRNHRQDYDENAYEWRKIKADKGQRTADESAVDQTDEQLTSKIGDDVMIDL